MTHIYERPGFGQPNDQLSREARHFGGSGYWDNWPYRNPKAGRGPTPGLWFMWPWLMPLVAMEIMCKATKGERR